MNWIFSQRTEKPNASSAAESIMARIRRLIYYKTSGAINDLIARLLAAKLAERWRQQVVVDNRPGAGTVIGTDLAATATPDGHTLRLVFAAFAINPTLYAKLQRWGAAVQQSGAKPE